MKSLHESFAGISLWLWAALADHLWQATLFAALIFLLTLLLRRGPARVRYALWLVASAKFVVPSALFAYLARGAGIEWSWLGGRGAGDAAAAAGSVQMIHQLAEPISSFGDASFGASSPVGAAHASELYCALTLVWLAGCVALVSVWLKRRREFLRAAAEGREVYAGREFDALEGAARRLGSGEDVRLLLSKRGVEPGVWRTRRPVVLLPESIAEHLDAEELEALMLHELVHVERRDNAVGNLQMALSCLLWFHPLVWFVSRRLLAEREQACDERVLEVGGRRGAYASSILKVVRFCFGWKVAGVSGAAAGSNLRRRIEKIMQEHRNPKTSLWQRALPAGAAALALVFSAGAGLLSHGQSGGGAQTVRAGRAGKATGGGVAGARGRVITQSGERAGVATQEIVNAPEATVYFENAGEAPLVINDARLKLITREQLRRADDEGADFFDEEEKSEFYVTLPTVTVTNVSGKTVKEVGISFFVKNAEKTGDFKGVIMGYVAALNPGESQTFHSEWRRRNMIMPGMHGDVSVGLAWATFADGTSWGRRARAPHPPAPPPPPTRGMPQPPAPPDADDSGASGSGGGGATAAGGVGEGRGEGQGTGRGLDDDEDRGAVRGGVLNGKVINAPQPVYPATARSAGAQGTVSVRIKVGEDGRVVSAVAVSGHPLLRSAAEEAARGARFSPTLLSGKPVRVIGRLSYNFVLSGKEVAPEQ